MNASDVIKLSEVPYSELQPTEDWLTSAVGVKGKITKITVEKDGNRFRTLLYVEWNNGKQSHIDHPYESEHVTLTNPERAMLPTEYVMNHINILSDNQAFLLKSAINYNLSVKD